MKITILYQYFQSTGEPGHSLTLALARFLQAEKDDVTVVAGEYGYMAPHEVKLPWRRRLLRRETVDGVPVIRTYTSPYGHGSFRARSLSFLSFSITCLLGLLRGPRPDVIYASSPPLVPMFSAWLASVTRRAPLVLEVRDLWPASFVELGIIKNKALIGLMSALERFLYGRAAAIVALTDGIRENIIARGWPASKVHTISCGIAPERFFRDAAAGGRVRAQHGWDDATKIVIYLGAHGPANNLEVIVRAASRLRSRSDIRFVLIGDGMLKRRLVEDARRLGLGNITFLRPVPAIDAADYINAADLCLATLQDIPLFAGAIPTKLIEYMACGRPVLIAARGQAQAIVRDADAGLAVAPGDDAAFAAAVERLLADPAHAGLLGENGTRYVREHFSLARNQKALRDLLLSVVNRSE